jgi:hypothetical protein
MQTKLNLPVLMKDVTKLQIGSLKVQQMAQSTGKVIIAQSGGKQFKLPNRHPLKYKLPVNQLRLMLHT